MKENKNEHKKKTLSHKEKKERSQMDCVKYKKKKAMHGSFLNYHEGNE